MRDVLFSADTATRAVPTSVRDKDWRFREPMSVQLSRTSAVRGDGRFLESYRLSFRYGSSNSPDLYAAFSDRTLGGPNTVGAYGLAAFFHGLQQVYQGRAIFESFSPSQGVSVFLAQDATARAVVTSANRSKVQISEIASALPKALLAKLTKLGVTQIGQLENDVSMIKPNEFEKIYRAMTSSERELIKAALRRFQLGPL